MFMRYINLRWHWHWRCFAWRCYSSSLSSWTVSVCCSLYCLL